MMNFILCLIVLGLCGIGYEIKKLRVKIVECHNNRMSHVLEDK